MNYLENTRHPWSCLLFVTPLVLAYEGGHLVGSVTSAVRNGAELWLRIGLSNLGFTTEYAAPALVIGILIVWSVLRRDDHPSDLIGVSIGMAVESIVFALGLYVLSRAMLPLFDGLGVFLQAAPTAPSSTSGLDPSLEQAVRYLGAGIYEETLFRLGLFSIFCWIFVLADFSLFFALNLAALFSALVFAGAHHLGDFAEPFHAAIFLFRVLAGFYFAWIYRIRGFGIAIGAHAGYDVLVGLLMPAL